MKTYLVGGAVRDKLLGLPAKERDYVVVGATVSDMLNLGFRQVGKEFPVFLHPKTGEEYALARMERKTGPGYKGFAFDTSPHVTLEADLIRRDLTINAMAMTENGDIFDPYLGKHDLNAKVLRHVSPSFAEDPVRILRVGRFLARFHHLGFHVAPETMTLMRQMVEAGEVNALVAERVWKELERSLGEKNPENFFAVLAECGAMAILFPQIDIHGQGIKALEQTAQLTPANTDDISLIRFAALLHNISDPKKQIPELSNRYRVPNTYRTLAKLVALHHVDTLSADTLSGDHLLELFLALDAFRREERFLLFLQACQAIAAAQGKTFNAAWLKKLVDTTKQMTVNTIKELMADGTEGSDLAKKLNEARRQAINSIIRPA